MDNEIESNSRDSPPSVITADIGAAMPQLPEPRGNSGNTGTGNSAQQPGPSPDIIMDPSPNRVKRFLFRSRKKSFPGGNAETESAGFFRSTGGRQAWVGQRDQQGSSTSNNEETDILEVVVPEVTQINQLRNTFSTQFLKKLFRFQFKLIFSNNELLN